MFGGEYSPPFIEAFVYDLYNVRHAKVWRGIFPALH